MRAFDHWQSNPSRGEDASKLTVRKKGDFSVQLSKVRYESVGAVGNLSGRFTTGATVAEDIPVGSDLANVHRASSFIITVVPFGEVRLDFSALNQSSQCTSPLCPPTRAAEHMDEFGAAQSFSKVSRFLFPMFSQRDICTTGMLVGQRPLSLTVPNKIEV
jgi:hypothetical protein